MGVLLQNVDVRPELGLAHTSPIREHTHNRPLPSSVPEGSSRLKFRKSSEQLSPNYHLLATCSGPSSFDDSYIWMYLPGDASHATQRCGVELGRRALDSGVKGSDHFW